MNRNLWLGAHVSAAGGVELAPERGASIGANCIQIFSANQRQWTPKPLTESQITEWWKEVENHDIGKVIVHASYLVNLCANEEEKLAKSRRVMVEELGRSQALGVDGVVLHPGSHLGEGEDVGVRGIAESLDAVFETTSGQSGPLISGDEDAEVKILLENTAGQGTNLGFEFSQLREMIRLTKSEHRHRLGVCIDTCHAFAAGYDVSLAEGWSDMWSEFDSIIGAERLGAIHLNDSQKTLGSRRDRHASIGEGEIGEFPFRRLVVEERFEDIPMTLETPSGMDGWRIEIETMRGWSK